MLGHDGRGPSSSRGASASAPETYTNSGVYAAPGSLMSLHLHAPFELRREIVRERPDLRGRAAAGRVEGVDLDGSEPVIRQDGAELTDRELGPAHPERGERDAEPGLGAGDDTLGGGHPDPALDGDRGYRTRPREAPADPAGQARPDDAVVLGEVGQRLGSASLREVGGRGHREARRGREQTG